MTLAPLLPFVLSAFSALAPADALDAEAKTHFDSGLARYNAKEYAEASEELRTAYALDPNPVILFAWAQAERLDGRCSRATKLYTRFLKTRPSTQQAEAARTGVERCKDQPDTATADPEEDTAEAPAPVVETVEEAPALAPEPEPEPEPRKRQVDGAGIGMLAGGVVLGAIGGGLLGTGQSKAKAAADGAASYEDFADDASQVRKLRISGGVLAGVGGALILAGIVKLVVHARQPRNEVSFWTAPTGAGVIVRLRF